MAGYEPAQRSPFRKQVASDNVNVFLDLDYFAEYHSINGTTMRCVIDDDIHGRASAAANQGVTDLTFTLFCRLSELKRQKEGTQLDIDGRIYTVDDWRVDEGMNRVTLRKPSGY